MKHEGMRQQNRFQYKGLAGIFAAFLVIAAVLFAERSGIRYHLEAQNDVYLKRGTFPSAKEVQKTLLHTCLALTDSENEGSRKLTEQFEQIFLDMKTGYDLVDVRKLKEGERLPFEQYETVVVMLSDLSILKDNTIFLTDWVKDGGDVMFAMTLEREPYLMLIEQKIGIKSAGYEYTLVDSIAPAEDFMAGGGRSYAITDPFDSSWAVELAEDAVVHVWNGDGNVPLVWERKHGKGKFVVANIGYYGQTFRGFYAAAYSLLTECTAYPVINGSTFYLDDFPSPVPSGNGEYILRDYGMSISDFYANVWWPDMQLLAEKYGFRYTGVVIENYEDMTDGTIESNQNTERFAHFGNMLLHHGGEVGYHGYNHQPLCLPNTDYGDVLPYHTWKNQDAMKAAMEELTAFENELYPLAAKSVYVPPSNVLSEEGRKMLAEEFPQIRTIASIYLPDGNNPFVYRQEFEVAEDGIVEQPRIISGAILDDYMRLTALSELNMHFVNNHFIHPDDLLDEDRGAALGWETLRENLDDYMAWLYTAAPDIRSLTGSELSGAVQRFGAVTITKRAEEERMIFEIGNLADEAYFLVRFNEGTPQDVTGGTLKCVTGNLYLLCAQSEEIVVEISR